MKTIRPDISVVVAAFNEEALIPRTVRKILEELDKHPETSAELRIVDDGSTDATGRKLAALAAEDPRIRVMTHPKNYGQGRALRTAFAECSGRFVVTLDADLSYGPEYIFLLLDALSENHADMALASPYARGGSVENVPAYRKFLSRYGNRYLSRMSRYPVSTLTCVVRAYRREALAAIPLASEGSEILIEILTKAGILGYSVCEIPARLAWPDEKAAGAGFRRVSSMRILRSVRLYLLLGWLARPTYFFSLIALPMILAGLYMALMLGIRLVSLISGHMGEGFAQAVSSGLKELFATYTYSVIFCGGFLIMGFQILAFVLLFLQNRLYFEELYRAGVFRPRVPDKAMEEEE